MELEPQGTRLPIHRVEPVQNKATNGVSLQLPRGFEFWQVCNRFASSFVATGNGTGGHENRPQVIFDLRQPV